MSRAEQAKSFYEREYRGDTYANSIQPAESAYLDGLRTFIAQHNLQSKRCLEVGCGRGAFQDLIDDYVGVDLASSVRPYLHKPFCVSSATELPFKDNEFDAIWTITVLEHVVDPEKALDEFRRVLRPGGVLYLAPAWQCRSWAAGGYPVRPYSDFDFKGKLIKASIPIRDSVFFRSIGIFPRRVFRLISFAFKRFPTAFRYGTLMPNYDRFWMSDSDAVNSMDPFEAILWFVSRGDKCLSHNSWPQAFLVRTGAITIRIMKA